MRIQIAFFLAIVLFIASPAFSEERCLASDTPRQCLQKLIAAHVYDAAAAQVAAATTGPSSLSSPMRSAVKDFLSVASAHLDASSLKDNGKALILDVNPPLTLLGAHGQVNLEATLADPVASPAVSSETTPGATTAVEQLGRGDDVAASLSFAPSTQRFGRKLDPNRPLLESMLLAYVGNAAPTTTAVTAASLDTPFAQIVPDPAAQPAAIAEYETAATAALPTTTKQLQDDFGRLVANQPQLFVTALDHYRKPAIGPRERGARLTWEISTDNINTFRRTEGRDCETKGNCLAAFNDYAARTAKEHRTDRLSLAIEYYATSTNEPGPTAPPFLESPTHGMRYSATYGREITSFLSGQQGRIDVTLVHQRGKTTRTLTTSSAPPSFARFGVESPEVIPPTAVRASGAITFTQPIADRLTLPLGIVVEDRDESFPGTQSLVSPATANRGPFVLRRRTVAVHAGLRYSVPNFATPKKRECCCSAPFVP